MTIEHPAIERLLNALALVLFALRLCIAAVGGLLLLPGLAVLWLYSKMGGE